MVGVIVCTFFPVSGAGSLDSAVLVSHTRFILPQARGIVAERGALLSDEAALSAFSAGFARKDYARRLDGRQNGGQFAAVLKEARA